MKRFIEGDDRTQRTLFPASLDEYIDDDNMVHVIDAFVGALDLGALGFDGADPKATGRPAYHPSVLLKIYVYGYLNRIASSRRLGDKIKILKEQMVKLKTLEAEMLETEDKQLSLTDPDARSMMTSGRGPAWSVTMSRPRSTPSII